MNACARAPLEASTSPFALALAPPCRGHYMHIYTAGAVPRRKHDPDPKDVTGDTIIIKIEVSFLFHHDFLNI